MKPRYRKRNSPDVRELCGMDGEQLRQWIRYHNRHFPECPVECFRGGVVELNSLEAAMEHRRKEETPGAKIVPVLRRMGRVGGRVA